VVSVAFEPAAHRDLYPFESRWLDLAGIRLHYLDEGPKDAPPVVMVHGNPTWSFYWRELAKEFRKDHRVIVPDHVGCGLSDKPGDARYPYRLERRVADLDALLSKAGVERNITLVLHDWGGMIGLAWASRFPERVKRLVLFNTAAFGLPRGKSFPLALRVARDTPLGPLLVRGFNAFARSAAHVGAKEKPLSPQMRDVYCSPYDSWANRIATLRFVQDIPLSPQDPSWALVHDVDQGLAERFKSVPTLICWGAKDFVFDDHFLDEWRRRLPHAEVHRFAGAGHYVVEDAVDRIVPLMRTFFGAHPAR
jgi:pimeloyl-ACP methyl ester carboxylesterase